MNSKEISIWLDEHWYDAIQRHHPGQTMEGLVSQFIDSLKLQLPKDELEQITREIQWEDQQREAAAEASRRFSVFRATGDGVAVRFEVEQSLDILHAATRLRGYLKAGTAVSEWRSDQALQKNELISEAQFQQRTAALLRGDPRITSVYDIDLDNGRFSALDAKDGWHTYKVKDISAAAYYAMKEGHAGWERRTRRFFERLDGKQSSNSDVPLLVRGEQPLPADNLTFEGEISEMDNRLNFYIPVEFAPDAVFGTDVCTFENDDWVNVYANYDLERGCVYDTLEICLVRNDGSELTCEYRLAPEEQTALLSKMDAYCQEQMGMTLEEARAQHLEQQAQPQMEQTM